MWQEVWRQEHEADQDGPAATKIGFSNGVGAAMPVYIYKDADGHWYWEEQNSPGHKGTGTSLNDCIRQAKKNLYDNAPVYF